MHGQIEHFSGRLPLRREEMITLPHGWWWPRLPNLMEIEIVVDRSSWS